MSRFEITMPQNTEIMVSFKYFAIIACILWPDCQIIWEIQDGRQSKMAAEYFGLDWPDFLIYPISSHMQKIKLATSSITHLRVTPSNT